MNTVVDLPAPPPVGVVLSLPESVARKLRGEARRHGETLEAFVQRNYLEYVIEYLDIDPADAAQMILPYATKPALAATNNPKAQIARELGISRMSVYRALTSKSST